MFYIVIDVLYPSSSLLTRYFSSNNKIYNFHLCLGNNIKLDISTFRLSIFDFNKVVILLHLLILYYLETIDVCIRRMLVFMSVVVTVYGSVEMLCSGRC